jgi:hypothetical protein
MRQRGPVLPYPGGAARVGQAVDADLLARSIAWAGETHAAHNETFNVTNGDVFVWENIWPAIAASVGMIPGSAESFSLRGVSSDAWDAVRVQYRLQSPKLADFVGLSMEYADYQMRYGLTAVGPASIVSTIKIAQAGFTEVMDTEAMFRKWFKIFQDKQLLPAI